MERHEVFTDGMLMADALPYRFTNAVVAEGNVFDGKDAEQEEIRFLNWGYSQGRKLTPADELNYRLETTI